MIDFREHLSGPSAYERACIEIGTLADDNYVALWVEENPRFLLRRLERVLGRTLHACIKRQHTLLWYVEVARTKEALRPIRLSDLMIRDHVRLHRMFVEAAQLLYTRQDAGRSMMARFVNKMCHHIYTESQILAPLLSSDLMEHPEDPVATMRRDHEKVAHTLSHLGCLLATPKVPVRSVNALTRRFSATLKMHKTREENLIFPLWDSALQQRHDAGAIFQVIEAELDTAVLPRSH
ncbi:MAG: hemerythrin domain-containing protein [Acidiferrobacteraceae bacterium]